MQSIGERLKAYWSSQGLEIRPGVSEDQLKAFESRYNVRLPRDMREYFSDVDGTGDDMDDESFICFWSLDRVVPALEYIPDAMPNRKDAEGFFIFADHSIDVFDYAIRLAKDLFEPNPVMILCPGAPGFPSTVAKSFSDFAEAFLTDPWQILH